MALLLVAYVLLMGFLLAHSANALAWMLYTRRTPEAATGAGFEWIGRKPKLSFTLMGPA
ncbi:MAG TPA: hypothetical protein VF115_16580 [Acidimicrobiia bacterium]